MNNEESVNWISWTKFIEQKNVRGVVIVYPVNDGKSKKVILPGDELPPEITEKTISLCIYRPLTRNERRNANHG